MRRRRTAPETTNGTIVHVWDPWQQRTKRAELVDGDIPGRPDVVRVIYLHSRTSARILRERLRPGPIGEQEYQADGGDPL